MNGEFTLLDARKVGGIMQQGGTFLGTARAPQFKSAEGRSEALRQLKEYSISALVVIGGNGSQTGAFELSKTGFEVVGIASTIDNDLYGAEMSIGVDTALNVALDSMDKLKITASSHHRGFLVEVMGRDSGYLALMTAIAGGAEAVLMPERETTPEQVAAEIQAAYRAGKSHALIVVAEGATYDAQKLAEYFKSHDRLCSYELRSVILGHTQRGGAPGAFDRILASRSGAAAIELLKAGRHGLLVGLLKGEIAATPLSEVTANKKELDPGLARLAEVLIG
jgi:6-phosphofructokinase 1